MLKIALIIFCVGLYFTSFCFKTINAVKTTMEATTLHFKLVCRWLKRPRNNEGIIFKLSTLSITYPSTAFNVVSSYFSVSSNQTYLNNYSVRCLSRTGRCVRNGKGPFQLYSPSHMSFYSFNGFVFSYFIRTSVSAIKSGKFIVSKQLFMRSALYIHDVRSRAVRITAICAYFSVG